MRSGGICFTKNPGSIYQCYSAPNRWECSRASGAVMFAMKDKLDISLGVAIGSSTQIAMFGIPFCVVAGWVMGRPMDLNFQLFETATLFITVLVVAFMVQDGTSNYLRGLMLVLCYLIVAASFFVHIDPSSIADKPPKPSH